MTPDDRRKAIIDAVQPLLLAQGADLTTRQIAEAAGVAEGTLFRVFESKQELLAEAAFAALHAEPALQQLGEVPLGPEPGGLTDRVVSILQILQAESRRTRALSMTMMHQARPHHPPGPDHRHMSGFRERRLRLADAVAAALDDYAAEIAVPTRTAAQVLLAMAFATSFDPTDTYSLPGPGGIADVVLHGIARGNQ